jgi:cellulose 1,4-beta-cellobiosidase
MAYPTAVAFFLLGAISVHCQQAGTLIAETHPPLAWSKCTSAGCNTLAGSVTLDANWRWLHLKGGYVNCYTQNYWDLSLCANPDICAMNCALEGANYAVDHGITTSGNAISLKFKTGDNVGSRVFLMASNTAYQVFKPKNQELSFDVDVSKLGCGISAALYFSQMPADGGLSSTNTAGAKYGTGYCGSRCPRNVKFINGLVSFVL